MEGQTIEHYKIAERIGKGGMGEVYRATDTKLNRDVAIKVIPDLFAKDPDRMARFSREAQVLASLNHPNIAAIYGLEESGGKRALVMELVDGETLAERIKRGSIPVQEALEIAKQIAEALEEAHEHGFIHRDLKPANVKNHLERYRKGFGFRPGQSPRRRVELRLLSRPQSVTDPQCGRDGGGSDSRHRGLHEPGASTGAEGRPPRRYLVLRRCALRDAYRQVRLQWRDDLRRSGQSLGTGAGLGVVTEEHAGEHASPSPPVLREKRTAATSIDG